MNISAVKTPKDVAKIMNKLDPLSNKQVLFLQALEQNGRKDLVDAYNKAEFPDEAEE